MKQAQGFAVNVIRKSLAYTPRLHQMVECRTALGVSEGSVALVILSINVGVFSEQDSKVFIVIIGGDRRNDYCCLSGRDLTRTLAQATNSALITSYVCGQ